MPVLAGLCTTSAEFVRSLQRYFVALHVRRLRCEIVAMLSLTSTVVELPQLVHGIGNIWVPRSNVFNGNKARNWLLALKFLKRGEFRFGLCADGACTGKSSKLSSPLPSIFFHP